MKIKKPLAILLASSLITLGIAGCSTEEKPENSGSKTETNETVTITGDSPIKISIKLTDGREMIGELYPDIAPISVQNFVKLINENFFDGLIFHRVISGFMIQGGGYDETFYDGNLTSKETESIKGEFTANGVENNLKHTRGVLSMARTSEPDSGSSQFFIMHQDSPHLDGQYAAFGKITEGLEVVDEIASMSTTTVSGTVLFEGATYPTQMGDVPEKPVVIETIDIIE
ncbi:MAG: peptidylprolyl isomerase [Clostridia bacterium]|nr:peptidylprolyl isomerase [Clostridia bacterium]